MPRNLVAIFTARNSPINPAPVRSARASISEPEIKFLFLVLFALGGLANLGKSEAVLPAYLVGMALAPFFLANRDLQLRMRAICFAFLTPFYFLKAGSLIESHALITGATLIGLFLAVKMATKFVGILPLTGTSNPEHMKQDLAALSLQLSNDDLRTIESIAG